MPSPKPICGKLCKPNPDWQNSKANGFLSASRPFAKRRSKQRALPNALGFAAMPRPIKMPAPSLKSVRHQML
jgi:hypothetical protein